AAARGAEPGGGPALRAGGAGRRDRRGRSEQWAGPRSRRRARRQSGGDRRRGPGREARSIEPEAHDRARARVNALIVVPVFNEADTIGEVVRGALRHAPVLVIDDGSRDESAEIARQAGAEVRRHPRRLGKGAAIRTRIEGARARGASIVVTLDGDGQHRPADLGRMLAAARAMPRTIVIGGRLDQSDGLPPERRNAIRVAGFFVNWACGLSLQDTQSGFRAYPVALFDDVRLRRGGFVLETEALVVGATRGWRVHEVPIAALPRTRQRSRFRPVSDGIAIGGYNAARGGARRGRRAGGPPPRPRGARPPRAPRPARAPPPRASPQ